MNEVNMIEDDDDEVQIETTSSASISCTSSLTPKKKKGVFCKEWLSINRYSSWLQGVNYDLTKARCKACLKMFSVRCDGKLAVEKHMTGYIHKKAMKTFEKNSSLTQFITLECELDKVAAAECVQACHGVKHGHSYRLQGAFIHCIVLFLQCIL